MSTPPQKIILDTGAIPHVDLDFMNKTHFEEIEMVKHVGKLISNYQEADKPSSNDTDEMTKELQEWYEHTVAHFERENDLMRETSFPAYRIHSEEHRNALDKLKSIVQTWSENQDIEVVSNYIFDFWPNWFNGHVNTMDMMTANFAAMNGYGQSQVPQQQLPRCGKGPI